MVIISIIIKSDKIYLENGTEFCGALEVSDKLISKIADKCEGDFEIDLTGLRVIPGLIDIHCHGGGGADTMDATFGSINTLSNYKLLDGVTSFCPTTVTSSIEKTKFAVENVNEAKEKGVSGAKVIGSFLEGPYINRKYKGAHPDKFIKNINLDEVKDLVEIGGVVSVAVAPEMSGAIEVIDYLEKNGIRARLGHSAATYNEVEVAFRYGAKIGIHTFNAMSPFNHREVGMVGALMLNQEMYCELICDLIHVCKEAVQILLKCKPIDKIVLITDCMAAGGLYDGHYMLGEMEVNVVDSVARTTDGALAGSTLRLINGVANLHKIVGVPFYDAVKTATHNPANVMDMFDEVGSIREGKKADIIAIDDDFNVKFVMVDGEVKVNHIY